MEELSLIEAIKDVIWEKIDNLRIVKLYRRTRYRLSEFFLVIKRYRQYKAVIDGFYSPWFDVSEQSYMLYMSNPDNLYCMFCGCKYVPFREFSSDVNDWITERDRQNHSEGCLWLRIEKLRTW